MLISNFMSNTYLGIFQALSRGERNCQGSTIEISRLSKLILSKEPGGISSWCEQQISPSPWSCIKLLGRKLLLARSLGWEIECLSRLKRTSSPAMYISHIVMAITIRWAVSCNKLTRLSLVAWTSTPGTASSWRRSLRQTCAQRQGRTNRKTKKTKLQNASPLNHVNSVSCVSWWPRKQHGYFDVRCKRHGGYASPSSRPPENPRRSSPGNSLATCRSQAVEPPFLRPARLQATGSCTP